MATVVNGPPDTAPPKEVTPEQLAATWKKRGGFDSLRKQLLADFLNAPEKDKFLADLDVSLPALLASTPSIARQDRKDRPNAVIRSMKQIETLKPQIKATEKRLREDEAIAKRMDKELARSLCEIRGVPFVDVDEEEPKPTLNTGNQVRDEASSIAERNAEEKPDSTEQIDADSATPSAQVKTEETSTTINASQQTPHAAADSTSEPLPTDGKAAEPSTSSITAPLSAPADLDMHAAGAPDASEPQERLAAGPAPMLIKDEDVEMKPAVPTPEPEST
ncbi:hypothetical protein JCM10908_004725 [Rhodotorula pacifica]|uniref:uncharacterized protein n=1 Tax=Rhodotorula pacifica TaxID=1495444 RepID=UPI003180E06B